MLIEMNIKGLMVDPVTNLPIVILTNYAETRNLPTGNGSGLIMTGPGFVTKDNAEAVIQLAAAGLR